MILTNKIIEMIKFGIPLSKQNSAKFTKIMLTF